MRIAFISYEYPPDTGKGGIGTYTKQAASLLAKKGCDVHVFAGSHSRECITEEDGVLVHRTQCSSPHDFRLTVLASFKKEHGIHPFELLESAEIHGNAWEIKKAFPSVPLIVKLHAPDYLVEQLKKRYMPFSAKLRFFVGALRRLKWDLGYWRPYEKNKDPDYHFTQLADGITAPSGAMKKWVVDNWQMPAQKITVIPNVFVPSPAFLSIPIKKDNSNNTIVFFGRLSVLKGLVNATKALALILAEFPDWHFTVIGDDGPGPYSNQSMRRWMQEKLKPFLSRVSFFDGLKYEELPAAITDSSIVLLPSLFESFSYTCIEAMAGGKAVVGSNNAGMADIIQDKKNGLLADPENYREIYSALKKLVLDPSLRNRLSIQARATASKDFADAVINMSMKYYEQIGKGQHG